MRGEHLTEDEGDFVSIRVRHYMWVRFHERGGTTYLNKALSSENPDASASTASAVPILRRANMARYRSKRGSCVFVRSVWRDDIRSGDTTSGFGAPESSADVAGAGSIEGYMLLELDRK